MFASSYLCLVYVLCVDLKDVELPQHSVRVVEEDVEEERREGEERLPARLGAEEDQEQKREGYDVHRRQADQESVPAKKKLALFFSSFCFARKQNVPAKVEDAEDAESDDVMLAELDPLVVLGRHAVADGGDLEEE